MTRYKSFGSFVAWYIGPSDDIAKLRKVLRKNLHRDGRRRQPHMLHTTDDLFEFLTPHYPDLHELLCAVGLAENVFNSPAHSEHVEQGRGWHAKTGRPQRLKTSS